MRLSLERDQQEDDDGSQCPANYMAPDADSPDYKIPACKPADNSDPAKPVEADVSECGDICGNKGVTLNADLGTCVPLCAEVLKEFQSAEVPDKKRWPYVEVYDGGVGEKFSDFANTVLDHGSECRPKGGCCVCGTVFKRIEVPGNGTAADGADGAAADADAKEPEKSE